MNDREERLDYIFGDHPDDDYVTNRFGWLDALLSDIRTLIDGGQAFTKGEIKPTLEGSHGAGNLSIATLVCTGLELVSALYTGKKYNNATDRVEKFIKEFFPDDGKKIPRILWQGIRNGINHAFIPNMIEVSNNRVEFTFFVNNDLSKSSHVTKSKDGIIIIHINSIQFYQLLKQAIDKYKSKLETDDNLQRNFIDGWESKLEHYKTKDQSFSTEIKYLLKKLGSSDGADLFV
jgi:flagellar hook-basal body complex protein FliE